MNRYISCPNTYYCGEQEVEAHLTEEGDSIAIWLNSNVKRSGVLLTPDEAISIGKMLYQAAYAARQEKNHRMRGKK